MRLKFTSRAGAAAGVLVAVLLAVAPPAVATPSPQPNTDAKDAVFVKFLVDHGVPYSSSDNAVKLAQSTCGILGKPSPTRIQDAVTAINDSVNMRQDQVQLFAAAAVKVYCPSVTLG